MMLLSIIMLIWGDVVIDDNIDKKNDVIDDNFDIKNDVVIGDNLAKLQGCFRQNVTVVTIYATLGEDALVYSLNEVGNYHILHNILEIV